MLFFQLLSNPLFAVVWVVAMLYAVTIHEFSHALAAKLLGDDTPVEQGRLTLNPLSHIDGMGLIMLLLVGFGWGRPVEFNPLRLRGGRVASALVGLAGPFSNIASVAALSGITRFLLSSGRYTAENLMIQFFIFLVLLNLNLFAFNLLPIPPLDGSHVLLAVLPDRLWKVKLWLLRRGPLLLIGLVLADSLTNGTLLGPLFHFLYRVAASLAG